MASSRLFRKEQARVMLIDCPGCAKSYHIIRAALGPNGRRVACPRCDTIWFVSPYGATDATTVPPPALVAEIEVSLQHVARALPTAPAEKVKSQPRPPSPSGLSHFARNLCVGGALLASVMAAIGFRADIVRLWPQSGMAYAALGLPVNAYGLELHGLHTRAASDASGPVLGIEGEIVNVRPQEAAVPPVELTIRDRSGRMLYSWTMRTQKRRLAAGE